ncbi:hypothetical protein QBC37DRAFT_150695 [Rhypophila decipiens]|uniref:Uncharacterized protein n=1 Tax=Rhypophila decipiens TaxID=261697 RepID=A0AAN6YEB5_9PEZI|nr:hypothetical protein QBC37DRAFT_150695 [Rhypophila decipiens]
MRPLISTSLFSLHLLSVLLFTSFFATPSSSSVAWAAEDGSAAAPNPYLHLRHARRLIRGGITGEEELEEADNNLARSQPSEQPEEVLITLNQQPTIPAHKAALSPLQVAQSQITPAPSLHQKRQDNNNQGQINALSDDIRRLSESFRSVSQASQQVSQSSQQLSQSLQQATQRLIQTEASIAALRAQKDVAEQASRSATQQANDASRRADEASASADRAVSAAFSEASRSASEMMASVTREMAASASSAIAQASEAASRILQVQAQATGSGTTATTPASSGGEAPQAQGAPSSSGVGLTPAQVALAVVGGILGGALVTIVGVVLVLRFKRKKKEKERMRLGGKEEEEEEGRGYPAAVRGPLPPVVGDYKVADYDDESNYSNSPPPSSRYSAVGYPPDVKIKEPQPPPPAAAAVVQSTGRKPGVGVGTGGGPRPGGGFKLGDPPGPRSLKFTLFPSPSATSSGGSPNARGSRANFPSLDTWLRNGTTVSPFATVDKAGAAALGVGIATTTEGTGRKSPEWPIRRS